MTTVKEAAKILLSVCDGAITKDGNGYTDVDSKFIRDVLSKNYFTYNQEQAIHKILIKYKKQLINSFDIDYDQLKFEVVRQVIAPHVLNPNQKLEISAGADQVKIPFGKYSGLTLAQVAEKDMGYVNWMAKNLDGGFIHDAAISVIKHIPISKPKLQIFLVGGKVCIRSPFEYKDLIKELPDRKWNPVDKVWELPLSVLRFIVNKFPEAELTTEVKSELDKAKSISELSGKASDNKLKIKFGDLELLPFQSVGVKFIEQAGGRALVADEMGCLDGDTIISLNRNGKGFKLKLSDLYLRFNDLDDRKRYKWNLDEITYARSLMLDGTIKLNKILNVINKGIKNTIKISTNNKEIILTPDHEILTPNGYIMANKLQIGDKILTNGANICKNCGSNENIISYEYAKFIGYCKECMYRQLRENHLNYKQQIYKDNSKYICGGLQYHPHNTTGGIAEHRLIYEAYINNLTLNEWLNKLKINDIINYKFLSLDIDIHHIDGNPSNNKIENLKAITRSEHHIIHNKYKNFLLTIPKEEIIINIENIGNKMVYDIIMSDLARNFVANGIIVHNCGKTIQALAYLRLHPDQRPALIVCPASLKLNWKKEAEKWLDQNEKISIIGNKIECDKSVYIINYDILIKYEVALTSMQFKSVVFDESHFLKNFKAKRTKSAIKIAENVPNRVLLTGTPILNRPKELFTQLNIINPTAYPKFTTYAFRYCGAQNNGFGYDFNGASNVSELNERLKTIMVRRTKDQVLPELPDKRRQTLIVPLANREEYNEAHGDFVKWLKETTGQGSIDAEHLVRIEMLKQLSVKGKMPAIIENIENFLESGKKLVIFAHHKSVIDDLKIRFSDVAVFLTGETSMEARQKVVDDFQNDPKVKLFIGNIQAAGVGLTLTSASDVMFLELPWTPSQLYQAEDRVHRIGQKNAVNIIYMAGDNTIDVDIGALLITKSKVINAVIDGKEYSDFSILKDLIEIYKN